MESDSWTCAQHQPVLSPWSLMIMMSSSGRNHSAAYVVVVHVKFTVEDVLFLSAVNTSRPIFKYFSTLVYRILVLRWCGKRNVTDWYVAGPVVSALANRFGCRIVSIIGSIIAGMAFAISQFSPNTDVLILTYGVMGGQLLMWLQWYCIAAKFYQTRFVVLISRWHFGRAM